MSQVIKCQNCGTYVPAEKAFCPNCSEPMEMEQKSDRSHSFSSDMMSTIRDDPEKYREMLLKTPAKKQQQQQPPQQQQQQSAAPAPPPVQVNTPPVTDRNVGRPAVATTAAAAPAVPTAAPAPVAQTGGKRNLILGISAVALLAIVIVLLFVFKVI